MDFLVQAVLPCDTHVLICVGAFCLVSVLWPVLSVVSCRVSGV